MKLKQRYIICSFCGELELPWHVLYHVQPPSEGMPAECRRCTNKRKHSIEKMKQSLSERKCHIQQSRLKDNQ